MRGSFGCARAVLSLSDGGGDDGGGVAAPHPTYTTPSPAPSVAPRG
jgi:hypothetical protein